MKRLIPFFIALLLPGTAFADLDLPAPYAEVAVGASFIPMVSTNTYTLDIDENTATGHANLNYDTAFTVGAEAGYAGVGMPEIRLGVAYEYLDARFDNGVLVGTVNGEPGSLPFTRTDVNSLGIDLDSSVQVVSGNVYYSLPLVACVRPYIGAGLGAAIVEHASTELAATATAGFRASLSDNVYVGLRYRYYWIEGPTDDLGIKFNAITNHSLMAFIGFYLQ